MSPYEYRSEQEIGALLRSAALAFIVLRSDQDKTLCLLNQASILCQASSAASFR